MFEVEEVEDVEEEGGAVGGRRLPALHTPKAHRWHSQCSPDTWQKDTFPRAPFPTAALYRVRTKRDEERDGLWNFRL